ncbi:MAG: KH domain-containing protein [candidate division WWE3 bacterium]|nr:KH domain-containing protein [candidate division WWE3 bacterium]
MLKELLEYIAEEIVSKPKQVKVSESTEGDGTTRLNLSVAAEDMGTVIGKQGRTIVAIRSLLKTAAAKDGKRVFIELEEKGDRVSTS